MATKDSSLLGSSEKLPSAYRRRRRLVAGGEAGASVQLYFKQELVDINIGEEIDIFYMVYDADPRSPHFTNESFVVRLSKDGELVRPADQLTCMFQVILLSSLPFNHVFLSCSTGWFGLATAACTLHVTLTVAPNHRTSHNTPSKDCGWWVTYRVTVQWMRAKCSDTKHRGRRSDSPRGFGGLMPAVRCRCDTLQPTRVREVDVGCSFTGVTTITSLGYTLR